jgi:hypothetical protein
MTLHILEIVFLILVLFHAVREVPKDLRRAWRRALRAVKANASMRPWRCRAALVLLMACASATCLGPVLYYGLECALNVGMDLADAA